MLHIPQLDEAEQHLLRVSGVVAAMDRHDPDFLTLVKDWLTEAERILGSNRLPAAGEVAGYRAQLISAERGAVLPGITFSGRSTARKVRDAAAADLLQKGQECMARTIRTDSGRVADAERVMAQIVNAARLKGVLPQAGAGLGGSAQSAWNKLSMDPDLGPAAVAVTGNLGPTDAVILFDRVASRM